MFSIYSPQKQNAKNRAFRGSRRWGELFVCGGAAHICRVWEIVESEKKSLSNRPAKCRPTTQAEPSLFHEHLTHQFWCTPRETDHYEAPPDILNVNVFGGGLVTQPNPSICCHFNVWLVDLTKYRNEQKQIFVEGRAACLQWHVVTGPLDWPVHQRS